MAYYTKSKTVEWETPQDLFDGLNAEFQFTLDVCATKANAKCEQFYTEQDDALKLPWTGNCWMNPPYGRQIGVWISKAMKSAANAALVACLVPARTDTRWFHEICLPYGEVRFIKNRLYFGDGSERAPFPSMVVVFYSGLSITGVRTMSVTGVCERIIKRYQ